MNSKKSKTLMIVMLLLTILFEVSAVALLFLVGILPNIINILVIVLMIGITVLLFFLLRDKKGVSGKRKAGVVISIVYILLLAIGIVYLVNTYAAFLNMSDEDKQMEDYYVVVLEESDYDKVKDIKGQDVLVHNSSSEIYKEAQSILKDEAEVKYTAVDGTMALKNALIDDKGVKADKIIFLSSYNYEGLCEYNAGFEDDTKIIYTVSVPIGNDDIAKRVGITKEPFNVYISGIDTFGGIEKVSRSDVNMIMTVNPVTKEILLTSIPRDTYIPLHSYGALDKLTHSGIYGIDETITTVEDWLGIDINYYIRVNFTSLKDIVDVIGGIEVESPYAFESSVSDYSYNAGTNHLDGKAALYFARERKSFEEGDQERIENQQRVLEGIIEKISSPVILTKYTEIMSVVGNEVQTNMSEKEISALVKMQLEDLGDWSIETISINGKGTNAPTYSMGSRQLFVVVPNDASVKAAQEAIKEVHN